MLSNYIVFGVGLLVSLFNILLWQTIIHSQLKQFSASKMNTHIKKMLLVFAISSVVSNIVPIWFDVYRLSHQVPITNIFYAYAASAYIYRTLTAVMFYLIYRA